MHSTCTGTGTWRLGTGTCTGTWTTGIGTGTGTCLLSTWYKTVEKAENQRKYLKTLIKRHLPDIKFVQPPRRNESENVVLSALVAEAVDSVIKRDADSLIDGIMKLSRTMRNEFIEYKDKWQFKAGLADFENPPLLHFLLEQILFGTHSKHFSSQPLRAVSCTL